MTRALVLGGGGPVGIGWEAGLAVGLADAGVAWSDAELIVGTSAGSVVGAALACGLDLADFVDLADVPLPLADGVGSGGGGLDPDAMQAVMGAMAAGADGDPAALARLGGIALAATTVDEATFVAVFAAVAGLPWPDRYRCTAVDTGSGEFRVWDREAGVNLATAVASSCSVPGVFPPITIGGRRYMDGGMRTALNADVAIGHEVVVAVSCFAPTLPEGLSDPVFDAIAGAQLAELESVAASGARLETIAPGPEFLEVSGWGLHLMDPSKVRGAFDAGRRQGADEAARIAEAWSA